MYALVITIADLSALISDLDQLTETCKILITNLKEQLLEFQVNKKLLTICFESYKSDNEHGLPFEQEIFILLFNSDLASTDVQAIVEEEFERILINDKITFSLEKCQET